MNRRPALAASLALLCVFALGVFGVRDCGLTYDFFGTSHSDQARYALGGASNQSSTTTSPTINSITNVGVNGGTINVSGKNFNVAWGWADTGSGVGTFFTPSGATSTNVIFTIPALASGKYNFVLSNADGTLAPCQASATSTCGGLVVTNTSSPQVILGANLIGWLYGSAYGTPSCTTSTWCDNSGYTQNFTNGGTPPTFNSSSANFNHKPSLSFPSGGTMTRASFSPEGSTTDMFIMMPILVTTPSTGTISIWKDTTNALSLGLNNNALSGEPEFSPNTNVITASATGQSITNVVHILYGYQHFNGTNWTAAISIDGNPEFTVTGSSSAIAVGSIQIGAAGLVFETPEIIVANILPTLTQIEELVGYLNFKYLIFPSLKYTRSTTLATTVTSSNNVFRITGTGFLPGTTVTSNLVSGLTTVVTSSTSLQVTVPTGTYLVCPSLPTPCYSLVITDLDGEQISVSNALLVTTAPDPMNLSGAAIVGWYRSDLTTPASPGAGGSVTALPDMACNNNDETASGTPTFNLSSVNFNSQPSISMGGSAYFIRSSFTFSAAINSGLQVWQVYRQTTAGTFYAVCYDTNANFDVIGSTGGSGPSVHISRGLTATWGTNINGVSHAVEFTETAAASGSSGTVGINVSNSSVPGFVTSTGTYNSNLDASGPFTIFASCTGTFPTTGEWVETIVSNAVASSGLNTSIQAYLVTRYGAGI
jgi:hypothetical protein